MSEAFLQHLRGVLAEIDAAGLVKRERLIAGPQGGRIRVAAPQGERQMVNLCANNYLGLANHPEIVAAAKRALDEYGFGMASVRFICGAQTLHRELEQAVARYLGKDDAILFAACFDANGGVFEALLGAQDAIVSDGLNHASIIDGVRLSKARRYRYANSDMNELEDRLKEADAAGARFKLIVTDGVFSMDGIVANLPDICALAERYGALTLVDDCHATGHLGASGRGTPELTGVGSRVDIVTGTFGKTLGGAMGGFVAAAQPIVDLLRQRARPYLFSNSLAPAVTGGSLKALEIAAAADDRRARLARHAARFRDGLGKAGFSLPPGRTPIIPVMLGEARRAQDMAAALDARGVFVAGFFYPVVPQGAARIRTQVSAALSEADVELAIAAFEEAGRATGVI
jgi:glycine C-acetyltransferase